jgi:hypothetical protein
MKKIILKLVIVAAIAVGVNATVNTTKQISEPPPGGWLVEPSDSTM